MSQRVFFGVLLVIFLGWIAAGTYASTQKLEEPVFLDHYLDEYSENGQPLELYYITNKNDQNTINFVTFEDIPGFVEAGYVDVFSDPFMAPDESIERYGIYELRSVRISLDAYEMSLLKEKKIFNEMTVHFSDGQSIVADIGEIIIHPYEQSAQPYLTNSFGMSGTDGSANVYQAEKNISISALKPHIPEEFAQDLKIHLPISSERVNEANFVDNFEELHADGEDYRKLEYPVKLGKGENFAYTIQNTARLDSIINSWMMMEGTTEKGQPIEMPAYLQHLPEWESLDIKAIIEQKGAAR